MRLNKSILKLNKKYNILLESLFVNATPFDKKTLLPFYKNQNDKKR